MPKSTPNVKLQAVKDLGAEVILHGANVDESLKHAREICEKTGANFIHPFDDPMVIAGQGTVGIEILRQLGSPPDAIYIAVGGGGLIAGVSAYVKTLWPKVRIVGVEPEDADSMNQALKAGRPVRLEKVGLFSDGVAVCQVGNESYKVASKYIDEMVIVDTDQTCAAIKDCFTDTRSIMEPSGALAIAGLKKDVAAKGLKNQSLVAIACGANMNFERLRFVAERATIGENKEALLAVTLPETKGEMKAFVASLGDHNLTEFSYRYNDSSLAHFFVGVEVGGIDDRNELVIHLNSKGFRTVDITEDELSKNHIRHMVGGRNRHITNERLYRFEFPEKKGAF